MHLISRGIVVVFLIGVISPPILSQAVREVTDEDVDRAIARIERYLWARQKADGGWYYNRSLPYGGQTALATFALLEAGISPNNPNLRKALDFLVKVKRRNLYVVTIRIMTLSEALAQSKRLPYRSCLEKDLEWLIRGNAARRCGAWGYSGPDKFGDNSCSQFALLALWEADRCGMKIDPSLIRRVEQTWIKRQRKDGGWTYSGQPGVDTPSTVSMTTAGIASLYLCQDVLTRTCQPYRYANRLKKAWAFLAENLKPDYIKNGYLAFCIQRVGMASGAKFIGGMDWFAVGAAKLAEPNPRGHSYWGQWGSIVRASFELIFLARGRIPLTFNKLAHGNERNWNFHARDVPHFTEYLRRNLERRLRWQVVKITDDVQLLLDAPILLITGTRALDFTPEQWAKLRDYSLRGGTLLFVPTHGSNAFLKSALEGLKKLYNEQNKEAPAYYTLKQIPADHPIYTLHRRIANGPGIAPIWGVSDGTRLIAIVSKRDICCPWQRLAVATGRIGYSLGVNLFLYATGGNQLRMRMRPVFVHKKGQIRQRAKIAWIKHNGNWHCQPYALNYLSEKLIAENRIALDVTAGVPIQADKLKGYHLIWMVGSDSFTLSDKQIDTLRDYLYNGGTLFINAVGGARDFNQSAREMLQRLFEGQSGVEKGYVSAFSPLITGKCGEFRGPPIKSPLPRSRAWMKSGSRPPAPLKVFMRSGRILVIYAPYGIHDTLDGHTAYGAKSYMPPAARDLAANIVLYALMEKPHQTSKNTN